VSSLIETRKRHGVDHAQCHDCDRWRPYEAGCLVDKRASELPLRNPLGFKVWLCGPCGKGAAA